MLSFHRPCILITIALLFCNYANASWLKKSERSSLLSAEEKGIFRSIAGDLDTTSHGRISYRISQTETDWVGDWYNKRKRFVWQIAINLSGGDTRHGTVTYSFGKGKRRKTLRFYPDDSYQRRELLTTEQKKRTKIYRRRSHPAPEDLIRIAQVFPGINVNLSFRYVYERPNLYIDGF